MANNYKIFDASINPEEKMLEGVLLLMRNFTLHTIKHYSLHNWYSCILLFTTLCAAIHYSRTLRNQWLVNSTF